MTRTLILAVTGAAYDEPEVHVVADTPAVRAAIRSWQSACDWCGDGAVTVTELTAPLAEAEFLDTVANSIGADADEIAALPKLWRAGQEWRR